MFNKFKFESNTFGDPLARVADHAYVIPTKFIYGLGIAHGDVIVDVGHKVLGYRIDGNWNTGVFPEALDATVITMQSDDCDYIGTNAVISYKNRSWTYCEVGQYENFNEQTFCYLADAIAFAKENGFTFDKCKVLVEGYR